MCKNVANRFMALSMIMLCACWGVRFWYWFHAGAGNMNEEGTGYSSCENSGEMKEPLCQMYVAGLALTFFAALVALTGGMYQSFQKNQAHMSAAFSLINLALATMWFVFIKEFELEGHENLASSPHELEDVLDLSESVWIIMGILHLAGFLFGIVYTLCVRCTLYIREDWRMSRMKNNFNYVLAMLLYLVGQVIFEWNNLDLRGCSQDPKDIESVIEDEFEKQMDGKHEADYTNRCASHAVGGSFLMLGALACVLALFLAFCQEAERQGRVQQFALAFSVGMACLAQTTLYWYAYSNPQDNGKDFETCSTKDPFSSGYCTANALGGIFSLLGFPLALFTAFAFLCGCMAERSDGGIVISRDALRKEAGGVTV